MRPIVKTAEAERLAKEHQEALRKAAQRTGALVPPWTALNDASRRARIAAARDLLEREVVHVRPR